MVDLFAAHFQNVAETAGGQKGRLATLSLDNGVGDQGCAVDDDLQAGKPNSRLVEKFGGPFNQGLIRLQSVGEQFVDGELATSQIQQREISESAADIHAEGVSIVFQTA